MRAAPLLAVRLVTAGLLAAGLLAAGGAWGRQTTVAVDFRGLDEGAFRQLDGLALEKRVVVRLVQEGFAVVAPTADPQVLLRVEVFPDRVVIATRDGSGRREVLTAGEPVRELQHLEIAQKIVDLARASRPAPLPVTAADPAREPRVDLEVGGGGGVLLRPDHADPLGRVDARLALGSALGLRLAAALSPASAGGITVVETQVQAGAGYRRWLGRLSLEAAALAGVLVHRYAVDEAAVNRSGGRVDLLITAPLTATLWPVRPLGIALRLAPGLASRDRVHAQAGEARWTRRAARLEAGLDLIWRVH